MLLSSFAHVTPLLHKCTSKVSFINCTRVGVVLWQCAICRTPSSACFNASALSPSQLSAQDLHPFEHWPRVMQ